MNCRKIGSFPQIKGYLTIAAPTSGFPINTVSLPAACRFTGDLQYISGVCWDAAPAAYACVGAISGTTGLITAYSNTPINQFAITGSYPAD